MGIRQNRVQAAHDLQSAVRTEVHAVRWRQLFARAGQVYSAAVNLVFDFPACRQLRLAREKRLELYASRRAVLTTP